MTAPDISPETTDAIQAVERVAYEKTRTLSHEHARLLLAELDRRQSSLTARDELLARCRKELETSERFFQSERLCGLDDSTLLDDLGVICTNGESPADKFAMTEFDARRRNGQLLQSAMDSLYATYVTAQPVAEDRGRAIQAINRMAKALGFNEVIRND